MIDFLPFQFPVKNRSPPVNFLLWTRFNAVTEDIIRPRRILSDLQTSHWRREKPVKVFIHGFADNGRTAWVLRMRNKFLDLDDVNIVSVEWSRLVIESI